MKKVLVTGGNGHLGFNLVKQLIENGFQVRATVRNKHDPLKTKHLKTLKGVEIVTAELLDTQSLLDALEGVDGIFHTAAPVLLWSENVKRDIVDPILLGTQNIFKCAKDKNIRKIIFTSSCSACGMNSSREHPLTETDWNNESDFPLLKAKIEAEKWALEYSSKQNINMISILPPTIIGPHFYKVTPSLNLYHKMYQHKYFSVPNGGCHIVDVRDVAKAHINAFLSEKAQGRYLIAGDYFNFKELFQKISYLNLNVKVPQLLLPMWSVYFLNYLDWINNKITKKERVLSLPIIKNFLNKFQYVSTEKANNELNWKPRDANITLIETFNWFHQFI